MNIYGYLSGRSLRFLFIGACTLTILLGVIDYLTGAEVSFSIFYLAPISVVAWFVGRRSAFVLSLLAGIIWLLADIVSGGTYSYALIPYWNALVRFGFFLIVSLAVSSLSDTQLRKEELAQFIFHDLRAPLSNTISGLRAVRDLLSSKEADDDLNDLVRMCLISCNRMSLLIQSLLDLSRLEIGKLQLNQGQVVVKELLDSALEQVSVYAKRTNLLLIAEIDQHIKEIYADSGLTERILVNLLSNAIKASKLGSSIRIQVAPYSSNLISIRVSDSGPGMTKEWVEKVFDKFSQTEIGIARGEISTGLGLTFCRLAVEAQGGTIKLESAINVGTTVTFTLPTAKLAA